MHATFSLLLSTATGDCFRVSYTLDKGRMQGPLTNRRSGGINGGGPGGSAGRMSCVVGADGGLSGRCPGEFEAVLHMDGVSFLLEGTVDRPLRPETATSGAAGAAGSWSRDIDQETGPFVLYDYELQRSAGEFASAGFRTLLPSSGPFGDDGWRLPGRSGRSSLEALNASTSSPTTSLCWGW